MGRIVIVPERKEISKLDGRDPGKLDAWSLEVKEAARKNDLRESIRLILRWKDRATTDYLAERLDVPEYEVKKACRDLEADGQVRLLDEETGRPITL